MFFIFFKKINKNRELNIKTISKKIICVLLRKKFLKFIFLIYFHTRFNDAYKKGGNRANTNMKRVGPKRKRKMTIINEKIVAIDRINKRESVETIFLEYGIGKTLYMIGLKTNQN